MRIKEGESFLIEYKNKDYFNGEESREDIEESSAAGAALILLDAPLEEDSDRIGGTGRTVDWFEAREIAAQYPVILSGGLTYRNVARAIDVVQPKMVDVSSGVEMAPGLKDPGLLEMFVEAVRETDI